MHRESYAIETKYQLVTWKGVQVEPTTYNIAELRDRDGFSHDELAKKLNVGAEEVRSWEAGTVSPTNAQKGQLASIFGVTTDQIAIGTGAKSPT